MSEPENFLTRWSRRKQDAEQTQREPAAPGEQRAVAVGPKPIEPENSAEEKPQAEFDLSTLPSIDSIDAGTDVRVFLQKGVPLELSRAALRRAWTSDPAIRDFIEVAENQWDFATGSDIPGFGPLEASEELRKMVEAMFESPATEPKIIAKDVGGEKAEIAKVSDLQADDVVSTPPELEAPRECVAPDENEVRTNHENIATQQYVTASKPPLPAKRRHGGALPD